MNGYATRVWTALWVAVVGVAITAGVGRADFVLVEDFGTLTPGAIEGQNGWDGAGLGGDVVTLAGDPDNQVLELTVDTGVLHKPMLVENGATRMLFLRFRFDGQHNYSLGMSHLASPSEFDHFGPELRKSGAQQDLKIHDGHTYADLTTVQPLTWYNLWVLIDNDAGNSQVWLHTRDLQAATPADQLDAAGQTVFDFRTDANADLIRFYLKAADGGSGRDPLWIDDIYLEQTSTVNLSNPVPEPATLSLLALAGMAVIRQRRA